MTTKFPLLVLVLDGLDWPWCCRHRGETAPLWALAARGCAAPLLPPMPPLTPSSAAALLCGREAQVGWGAGDLYASSRDLIRLRPWVRGAAEEGVRVGLCNVPLTWPAFPVPAGSWLTSGFPVDAETLEPGGLPWRYPQDLDVAGYPIGEIAADHGPGGMRDLDRLRAAEAGIVRWLLDRAPAVDLLVCWLRSSDGAGHHLGTADPAYGAAVAALCALAQPLLDAAGDALVMSDHGMDELGSDRCAPYRATAHGPAATVGGCRGGHAEEGVLFAAGPRIRARGTLAPQRLVEVPAGLFDLLQVPAPAGVTVPASGPGWARPSADGAAVGEALRALGYR